MIPKQVEPTPVFYPNGKGKHPDYQEDFRVCYLQDNRPLPPRIKCTKQQYDTVILCIREFIGEHAHIEANMPIYFEIEEK